MLRVNVAQIPPEGLPLDAELQPAEVHLEGEDSFTLMPGARLRGRLERGDDESIHLRGHLSARLFLQCGRCLESFELPVEQELDLFYLAHQAAHEQEEEEEVELTDREVVVAYYAGRELDLGEALREQLFLSLPMKRVCRPDCAGLCPSCGINRNQATCACVVVDADARLSPLKDLLEKGSS